MAQLSGQPTYRIRCPPGSLRRQFTMPTTPEVGQPRAVSHTGRGDISARISCRARRGWGVNCCQGSRLYEVGQES